MEGIRERHMMTFKGNSCIIFLKLHVEYTIFITSLFYALCLYLINPPLLSNLFNLSNECESVEKRM